MKIESIIFVCLGNICRSPLAEEIAKKYIQEYNLDIKVDSAGTGNWHIGQPPCPDSIKIAKQKGIDISHQRARLVNKSDFDNFDLIIALDDNNVRDLKNLGCKNPIKLGEFGFDSADVPDPYFFDGFEGFDKVYEMIDTCVKNLIKNKVLNKK